MLEAIIIQAIEDTGFDEYRVINASDIIFAEDVFKACAQNTCGNYNTNYACPPLSGDMAENKARFEAYRKGIIVNKVLDLGKYYEKMETSGKMFKEYLDKLREALKDKPVMIAGPGGCDLCKTCAAIDGTACRFPDKRRYSMEGSGMDIVAMSRTQNMTYNGGHHKVGYFGIVMYDKIESI